MISLLEDFDSLFILHFGKTKESNNLAIILFKRTLTMIFSNILMQFITKMAYEIGSRKFSLQMDGSTDISAICY